MKNFIFKKIKLLIMLFCIVMLFGVELDTHDNIMPQKLKYNELPENYPKELRECFSLYRNLAIKFAGDEYSQAKSDVLNNYIKELTFEEKMHILYLNWLAQQCVPQYYHEYQSKKSREFIYNDSLSNRVKSNSKIFTGMIMNRIETEIFEKHPKLRHIVSLSTPKWVKAEILDFERYDRQNYTNLVTKVKVIDDLSDEMLTDELTIVINGSTEKMFPDSGKAQFQRGKTFLIASGPTFLNTITKNIEYDGNLLDTNNPIIFYTSAIHCFEVIDDEFTWETTCNYWLREIQSFLFAGEAQGISCADGHSVFITLPIEQEGSKISYQIVRDRLTEQMDFLRQYKDVKLNNKKDEY